MVLPRSPIASSYAGAEDLTEEEVEAIDAGALPLVKAVCSKALLSCYSFSVGAKLCTFLQSQLSTFLIYDI